MVTVQSVYSTRTSQGMFNCKRLQ